MADYVTRRPSSRIIKQLEDLEGFSPVPKPDIAGQYKPATEQDIKHGAQGPVKYSPGTQQIGYGENYPEVPKSPSDIPPVFQTQPQAEDKLVSRLQKSEQQFRDMSKTPLTDQQVEVLASKAYNTGLGKNLVSALKSGNIPKAAEQFDEVTVKGRWDPKISPGLMNRRIQEVKQFLQGTEHESQIPSIIESLKQKAKQKPGYTVTILRKGNV